MTLEEVVASGKPFTHPAVNHMSIIVDPLTDYLLYTSETLRSAPIILRANLIKSHEWYVIPEVNNVVSIDSPPLAKVIPIRK